MGSSAFSRSSCDHSDSKCLGLVLLQALIRLSVLAESITTKAAGALGVLAATAAGVGRSVTGLAALLASLMGVDLAVGELAGADALVGLAVLAETVVLLTEQLALKTLDKKKEEE